jgi:hypothetical protein
MDEILITRIDYDLAQSPQMLREISKSFIGKKFPFPATIASGVINSITSETDDMHYLIHQADMNVTHGIVKISCIDILSKRCNINLIKNTTNKLDIFTNSIQHLNNLLRQNFGITRLVAYINERDLDIKSIFKTVGFEIEGTIPSYGWDINGVFSINIYALNLTDRNNI